MDRDPSCDPLVLWRAIIGRYEDEDEADVLDGAYIVLTDMPLRPVRSSRLKMLA